MAPAGTRTSAALPACTIRAPSTTSVAFSIAALPSPTMSRAPSNAVTRLRARRSSEAGKETKGNGCGNSGDIHAAHRSLHGETGRRYCSASRGREEGGDGREPGQCDAVTAARRPVPFPARATPPAPVGWFAPCCPACRRPRLRARATAGVAGCRSPSRYWPISRLSRATTSAGVPAGATMAKKPSITMPGTVSLQRRQVRQARKALARGDGEAADLAGLHHSVGGGNRAHHDLVDAAGDVLGHLRGGAVGHFNQAEVGALVEQLCRERGGAGRIVEGDREPARIGFGVGDQLGDRRNRQARVHRQHLRTEAAYQRHRREVARGVVREAV